MSVYYVNKVFHKIDTEPDFLSKFREGVDDALQGFRLTSEERDAIKVGDIETLYRMGVHAFLLNALARHRLCGLDRDSYIERIKKLGQHRTSPAPGRKGQTEAR